MGRFVALAAYSTSEGISNVVVWLDTVTGVVVNCTADLPPDLSNAASAQPVQHSLLVVSADGRVVAFRSEASFTSPGAHARHALSLFDASEGTLTVICLRTNGVLAGDPKVPAHALQAQLSADGAFVAYATPTPPDPAQAPALRSSVPFQVYLYETPSRTTRLVSAAPDGVTPANADAVEPRLATDGRGVAFLSRATNLLPDLTDGQLRAFWYDRETGVLSVAASLGDLPPEAASLTLSPNGDWLAVCAPRRGRQHPASPVRHPRQSHHHHGPRRRHLRIFNLPRLGGRPP